MPKLVEMRVTPHQKESTCSNTFNLFNVLCGFSYLIYNFYIEFGNWDKIAKSYEATSSTSTSIDPLTNNTNTVQQIWTVSVSDESESIVMRLEEVCMNIVILQDIFFICLLISAFSSGVSFIIRQMKICTDAVRCDDARWSCSMMLVLMFTILQSCIGLFIIILLSPTSFLTCYKVVARYFCTISVSILTFFFLFNIILSAISKPILTHKITYEELHSVGKNCEVDVVREKSRRKAKQFFDSKDADEEEVELTKQYKDNTYDSGSEDTV